MQRSVQLDHKTHNQTLCKVPEFCLPWRCDIRIMHCSMCRIRCRYLLLYLTPTHLHSSVFHTKTTYNVTRLQEYLCILRKPFDYLSSVHLLAYVLLVTTNQRHHASSRFSPLLVLAFGTTNISVAHAFLCWSIFSGPTTALEIVIFSHSQLEYHAIRVERWLLPSRTYTDVVPFPSLSNSSPARLWSPLCWYFSYSPHRLLLPSLSLSWLSFVYF